MMCFVGCTNTICHSSRKENDDDHIGGKGAAHP